MGLKSRSRNYETKMKFIVAEKESSHGMLLVITDKDLLGKKFEEGRLQLDLTKDFYKGEEKNKEEIVLLFQKARHIHLTGTEAVKAGIELDCVQPERVLTVKGVPHAQIVVE